MRRSSLGVSANGRLWPTPGPPSSEGPGDRSGPSIRPAASPSRRKEWKRSARQRVQPGKAWIRSLVDAGGDQLGPVGPLQVETAPPRPVPWPLAGRQDGLQAVRDRPGSSSRRSPAPARPPATPPGGPPRRAAPPPGGRWRRRSPASRRGPPRRPGPSCSAIRTGTQSAVRTAGARGGSSEVQSAPSASGVSSSPLGGGDDPVAVHLAQPEGRRRDGVDRRRVGFPGRERRGPAPAPPGPRRSGARRLRRKPPITSEAAR